MSLEKERIEKKHIEEMNQAKLRFFTNVSHEFRTPLTLIISQVELMLQKNTIPPSLHNSIFRIRKHAQQMKLLISELLDFRKFDQNYIQLKLSEQSLNTFLEEVYLSFSAYASQKSISYHLKLLEQDISIWIDDWQMRKVLFNLLSNAFKHVPDKGEISILTSTTPDQVVIAVKDSGNGISKEEQERIFDRFYQADNRNKALHVGTGIGLALTKSIIQLHHGTIEVESESNEGSCFIVKLPKTRDCFEKDTEVVFLESPEKEPMVQENTIPDENFMKIVSDVMMPVMTGTEMCLKIKNNISLCHIPVVLLTALDTVDQNIEGLRRGADDYITKPFNAKILITRCNNLIRNRLLMQSRFAKDQILEINLLAANPIDKSFLDRVIKVVDKHIDNEDFDIGMLCQELGMGRTLLHTKFKALTGMTPNEFILNHRLKIASLMLKNEPYLQVAEISDRLGFGSPRYFSRCFKNQYNVTPMEYRKGAKQENLK